MNLFSFKYYILIFLLNNQANGIGNINDIITSGKNVAQGVIPNIPNVLPQPNELLEISKNVIAGYPFKLASTIINNMCSLALASNSVQPKFTPDVTKMNFILMTPTKNYTYPLTNPQEMWNNPKFNKNKTTVILATGWTTDLNETNNCIYTLSNAFFCRGTVNFIVLDSARFIDTLYSWSAFNTEEIGDFIGTALVQLFRTYNINNVHLIGHSLGAHIVGQAGRRFEYETGLLLKRITGLDPAKPCFNEGEMLSGLQRGDAEFIDVIHSNPGVLGKYDSVGDVDFYPGGLSPLPAGCLSISCAHARAWEYFAESVLPGNEYNFIGIKCNSLTKLQHDKCKSNPIPMGYNVPLNKRGNYFLEVNSESPYGKNATTDTLTIYKCIDSNTKNNK